MKSKKPLYLLKGFLINHNLTQLIYVFMVLDQHHLIF